MPKMLTAEQRNQFDRIKNTRAIRVAVFDAAIAIGAILLVAHIAKSWPQYAGVALLVAGGLWVGLIIERYRDWKSLTFLEEHLNRDEDERNSVI